MKKSEIIENTNGDASRTLESLLFNCNKDNYHDTLDFLANYYLDKFEKQGMLPPDISEDGYSYDHNWEPEDETK